MQHWGERKGKMFYPRVIRVNQVWLFCFRAKVHRLFYPYFCSTKRRITVLDLITHHCHLDLGDLGFASVEPNSCRLGEGGFGAGVSQPRLEQQQQAFRRDQNWETSLGTSIFLQAYVKRIRFLAGSSAWMVPSMRWRSGDRKERKISCVTQELQNIWSIT